MTLRFSLHTRLTVSPPLYAVAFLVFLQWREAGATVGGAGLAEVASLFGPVYVVRASEASWLGEKGGQQQVYQHPNHTAVRQP